MRTNKLFLVAAAAFGAACLAGCSTVNSRIASDPGDFNQLTPAQQAMVKSGQITVGLPAAAVRMALGDPTRITVRTNSQGQTQIWHYSDTYYYDYGPYWGIGWAGGFGPYRRGWGWGGWYDPWWDMPPYPVIGPDRIRVTIQNDRVVSIEQENIRT